MIKVYTYDIKKRKEILAGEYSNDTFIKTVAQKKHYCWKHKGYGIQDDVFFKLESLGCKKIVLKITDANIKKEVLFSDWKKNSITDNLGSGLQIFCPEKFYTKIEREEDERVSLYDMFKNMPEDKKIEIKKKLGLL